MKFYLAPLEGITGYVYRMTYQEVFHNIDKYFIPFVEPHQKRDFNAKEQNELCREHNQGFYVVPQILTNQAEGFLRTAEALVKQGYEEVNLNLGCPSGTVVSKGKGAGFLEYPEKLDEFLDTIFQAAPCRISIKTRIGRYEPAEFSRLLEIYHRYPLEELIIHPRTREDYYKGTPDWEAFGKALITVEHDKTQSAAERNGEAAQAKENGAKHPAFPVCYNGDIFTPADYQKLLSTFPKLDRVMLGRGIIGNPCLVDQLLGQSDPKTEREKFWHFHDLIYERYQQTLSGDRPLLFKMKELWCYLGDGFPEQEKWVKKLKKVQKRSEYEVIVAQIFRETER